MKGSLINSDKNLYRFKLLDKLNIIGIKNKFVYNIVPVKYLVLSVFNISLLVRLLIQNDHDGIMIPTPQYPIYSALITRTWGHQVPYYLDESKGWGMSVEELERAYKQATDKGVKVRALVVINPGNPTGQILQESDLKRVIEFAHDKKIMLLSDEVYQKNIYGKYVLLNFNLYIIYAEIIV